MNEDKEIPIPLNLLADLLQVLHENFFEFVYHADKARDITYKLEKIIKETLNKKNDDVLTEDPKKYEATYSYKAKRIKHGNL